MKIAPFDDLYPLRVGSGYGGLSSSSGSNSDVYEEILSSIASNASTGSNTLLKTSGGVGRVTSLGSIATATTLMIGGANYFELTLTANTTVTFTGWPATGYLSEIGVRVTEDGSGGWTPTFSGVTWIGGTTPTHTTTAGSSTEYVFWSSDGGSTIIGGQVGSGSGGTPATTVTSETTFGLSSAVGSSTNYARQDHTHGSPPTSAIADAGAVGEILITDTPAGTPLVFADLIQNEAEDDLVYADL